MKDKFEMGAGGVAEVEMPIQETADRPPLGGDANKDLVQGLQPRTEKASTILENLQPQTSAQQEKKGFLSRIKSLLGGKEKSSAEKIDNQLVEDIKALTHITKSNAGMGGLGNFSSGGFKGAGGMVERYGLSVDEFSQIVELQDSVENLNAGPEKVAQMRQLNTLKASVMQQMRAAADRMKAN